MILSKLGPWMCAALLVAPLVAQSAAPTTYSVTMVNGMFGTPVTQQIYRNGSKVVIENDPAGGPKARSYYDLNTGTQLSWNPVGKGDDCSKSSFQGDWGDPFAVGDLMKDLQAEHAKQTGTETVNGFQTKVLETDGTGPQKLKAKAWVDTKTGGLVKLQMEEGGKTSVMLEMKSATFSAPPAAALAIPAGCAKVGGTAPIPKPPTDAETIAAETGDKSGTYSKAMSNTKPTNNACNVDLRVLEQGTMKPITGIQVAFDRTYDVEHPPHYTTGISVEGHRTYSGGGIKELTAQVRNGELKIENAPATMYFSVAFGQAGEVDAVVYRQCPAPTSVLLLLVKNPQSVGDGYDWVWALTGKYAKAQ